MFGENEFNTFNEDEVFLYFPELDRLVLIEEIFAPDFLKGIDHFKSVVGDRCASGFVLYNGREQYTLKGTRVMNLILHEGIEGL